MKYLVSCTVLMLGVFATLRGYAYDRTALASAVVTDRAPWTEHLSDLPPELRGYLFGCFDITGRLPMASPEKRPSVEQSILTDDRRKYSPGCMPGSGKASALLVRAKSLGEYWIVQYEHGGIAPMATVLVLQRDGDGHFVDCDAVSIRPKSRPKEIAKALSRTEDH